MTERIQSIQALRFLAAAAVVYHHAAQQAVTICHRGGVLAPLSLPEVGAAGVDVFFVISGFVIAQTGLLAQPRPTARSFFWKRWSRVAPLFYLVSVPVFFLLGATLNMPQVVATLFFWPAAGLDIVPPYVSLGWTLCFEMVFYSAVALVLIGGKVRRNALIATVIIAALAYGRGRIAWHGMALLANPIHLEFAAGVGLAVAWPWLKRTPSLVGVLLATISLILFLNAARHDVGNLLGMGQALGDTIDFRRVIRFGLPAAMLVMGALICEQSFRRLPGSGLLVWLGDASYSIYLGHCITMLVLFSVWRYIAPPPSVIIIVGVAFGLAGGVALHRWVEAPLLSWVRHWPRYIQYARAQVRPAESPS